MGEMELVLTQRAEQGDLPSIWALEEIARLVDKANQAVRDVWALRREAKDEPVHSDACPADPPR